MRLLCWTNETSHAIDALFLLAISVLFLLLAQSHYCGSQITINYPWINDVIMKILLFCFFSLAAKHKVMPLESSPVWGKRGSLHTCGAEIKCQWTMRWRGGQRLGLSYLKIPKRAFDTVLSHVLHFCLIFLLSVANRSQHRPIVNLQLHRLLRLQWRRWLSGRHASGVWRRAWKLRVSSGFVEIKRQLRTFEVTQPYILLKVRECWLSICLSGGQRTYTNKWHKNLARVLFLVVDHRFGDGNLGAGTAAV